MSTLVVEKLWHWTCDHSAPLIRESGIVKPHPQPLLDMIELSWWTDLGPEHRYELGLTSNTIKCDRMAARFQARHIGDLLWWSHAARGLRIPRRIRDELEDGRLPAHWWIAVEPVEVIA